MNIIKIWKNKNQILEGIKNSIFTRDDVEQIAKERNAICIKCELYDDGKDMSACVIPGTHPCCNKEKGGCGCCLHFKVRSLSTSCPLGYWDKILTENEEDLLNQKLAIK